MTVTVYHNPRCSKSRQTLSLIEENDLKPEIIEYLKTPLRADQIESLLTLLHIDDPRSLMRQKEAPYLENNLKNPMLTRAQLIKAIAENPILLERPVVVTDKGARICRQPELVLELL
jgi:arsenate reductase